MPYSTGTKEITNSDMFQQKIREVFPVAEISAESVPDLKVKNVNEIFPASVTVQVVGIEERDIGGGQKKLFYRLEIMDMGLEDRTPDEMSAAEIEAKIDEEQP
jgi:hypothetical protein